MYKQNLHTHSTYCDGKDALEDIVLAAMEAGFDSIGFSGHSYTPFDESYCMSEKGTEAYFAECRHLCDKYKGKIAVHTGIEQDLYAPASPFSFDYVIGSVHYIRVGDEYIPVDVDAETLKKAAEKHFGGDMYALVEAYYDTVASVAEKTRCHVVGHFDVITKFTERTGIFDPCNERCIAASVRALDRLLAYPIIFEINSGAVAKGYRSEPYPSKSLLSLIAERGGKITFSSDCHDKSKIGCHFDEMKALARAAGFKECYVLRDGMFVPVPLL